MFLSVKNFCHLCYACIVKFIRIFLLALILIGITLLFTQNFWLSKLVEVILLQEKNPVVVGVQMVQPNSTLQDGKQCYSYTHNATIDAPYTVHEFIDITIQGANVTGVKQGTQAGPNMTNGYTGSIVGIHKNNTITDIFSYVVEGSKNKEQEIYRTSKTGIEKLRYPLVDKKGILTPDTTKSFTSLLYTRVSCIASN
jgi:hypothetical protein